MEENNEKSTSGGTRLDIKIEKYEKILIENLTRCQIFIENLTRRKKI